jgi:hypothetical protein
MPKLTKSVVAAAKPNTNKEVFLWDSELRGLGLRVKPSGAKSYFLQYRNAAGRSRRFTIKDQTFSLRMRCGSRRGNSLSTLREAATRPRSAPPIARRSLLRSCVASISTRPHAG